MPCCEDDVIASSSGLASGENADGCTSTACLSHTSPQQPPHQLHNEVTAIPCPAVLPVPEPSAHGGEEEIRNGSCQGGDTRDSGRVAACVQEGGKEETRRIRPLIDASPTSSFTAHSPLAGEELVKECCVDLYRCRLFLTKYRLLIVSHDHTAALSIPLLSVESVEAKDMVMLHVICKDGKIIRLRAENSETALQWFKKLAQATCVPRSVDDVFAFNFHSSCKTVPWLVRRGSHHHLGISNRMNLHSYYALRKEFKRLELSESTWRISTQNEDFEICPTYPQYLIVPTTVSSEELNLMKHGRFYNRLPAIVWRSKNGAVLVRSSQPTVGFFGMTNEHDVKLYDKIRSATGQSTSKFLIVDARSYTAAWANRAKGGGFETNDTYNGAEVVFMGLPNIHNIRYSFHQLRQLLNSTAEQSAYLQNLQTTQWFQNMGQLFTAVERCLRALREGTNVLVHCSDGWDRTTQIVSLCMLIADQYYRTFEGFQFLIQRQWVEFGHKFADRGGVTNGDENEKSPVFLQFLDCVYQLWMKNPDCFEFNRRYLMKLAQHTYSGLFGTFLFNSIREAAKAGCVLLGSHTAVEPTNGGHAHVNGGCEAGGEKPPTDRPRCYAIWDYLGKHNFEFVNPAYEAKCRSSGVTLSWGSSSSSCSLQPTPTKNHAQLSPSPPAGNSSQPPQFLSYPKLMCEFELWRDVYCCTQEQSLINNPDAPAQSPTATSSLNTTNSLASSGSIGSTHDVSIEKSATLSRSQSATSLTSLEKNTLQTLYHNSSGHFDAPTPSCQSLAHSQPQQSQSLASSPVCNGGSCLPNASQSVASTSTVQQLLPKSTKATNRSSGDWQSDKFLDPDGLSRVPIPYEDRVVTMYRDFLHMELNLSRTTDPSFHSQYGHHYHQLNGLIKANGPDSSIIMGRRIRNESVDSTTFEVIDEYLDEFQHSCTMGPLMMKRKHDSASTTSSVSSTFTSVPADSCHSAICTGCRPNGKQRIASTNSLRELEENGDQEENDHEQRPSVNGESAMAERLTTEQTCNGKQQAVVG